MRMHIPHSWLANNWNTSLAYSPDNERTSSVAIPLHPAYCYWMWLNLGCCCRIWKDGTTSNICYRQGDFFDDVPGTNISAKNQKIRLAARLHKFHERVESTVLFRMWGDATQLIANMAPAIVTHYQETSWLLYWENFHRCLSANLMAQYAERGDSVRKSRSFYATLFQ